MEPPLHSLMKSSFYWVTVKDIILPKRPKMQQLAGKVMASVIRDAYGKIFIDYLDKEKPCIGNILKCYWCIWNNKSEKIGPNWARKSALSSSATSRKYLFINLKKLSPERDVASVKRWSPKVKSLKGWPNRSIRKT